MRLKKKKKKAHSKTHIWIVVKGSSPLHSLDAIMTLKYLKIFNLIN